MKSLFIILLSTILSIQNIFAQDRIYNGNINKAGYELYYVFETAEVKPEFPRGYAGFINFLYKHINFPQTMADTLGFTRIYGLFTVTKTGDITEIIASGENEILTAQVRHTLEMLPSFKPGGSETEKRNLKITLALDFTKDGKRMHSSNPYIIPFYPKGSKECKEFIRLIKKEKRRF